MKIYEFHEILGILCPAVLFARETADEIRGLGHLSDELCCALLDARQLAARIVRLECDATRSAQGTVRATVRWLQYTLTMFSAAGRLNYLSGASRRRAVYSAVSSGIPASRPLFDAVLGDLHGGTSSAWLLAQN